VDKFHLLVQPHLLYTFVASDTLTVFSCSLEVIYNVDNVGCRSVYMLQFFWDRIVYQTVVSIDCSVLQ